MATLKWEELECGWQCSECGARYSEEEISRCFGYAGQTKENFMESHCMDCGAKWEECEM